jgi:hypothetical protein
VRAERIQRRVRSRTLSQASQHMDEHLRLKPLSGSPKKRGQGFAATLQKKPSPALRSNAVCSRPKTSIPASGPRSDAHSERRLGAFSEVYR